MNIIFFQNCISPHQIPYISECINDPKVQGVYLIVPRVDYSIRKDMGWDSINLLKGTNIKYFLTPNDEQVCQLLENESNIFCIFSGIRADKDVFHWFKLSLKYQVHRYIITEPPYTYNKPLWMHYIRFYFQDYSFIKSIYGIETNEYSRDIVRYSKGCIRTLRKVVGVPRNINRMRFNSPDKEIAR